MAGMVLFNIGWMTRYRGETESDRLINGGKYVDDNETGGEIENFLPRGDRCTGYVRLPGTVLKPERLGASPDARYVDGATVVFSATRPGGGGYVVGWYRDARVWCQPQEQEPYGFNAEARAENCTLLKVDDRVFPVPRARAGEFGLGQSNVRYLDEPNAEPFVNEVHRYIQRGGRPRQKPRRASGQSPNPALRKQVETAAVRHVIQHYESNGFTCRSVEHDNVGWDLVCTREGLELLVDAKGCSGNAQVELTPNEYAAMKHPQYKDRYRLAIVSTALEDPVLSIVKYNLSDDTWRDQRDRVASLRERLGVCIQLC